MNAYMLFRVAWNRSLDGARWTPMGIIGIAVRITVYVVAHFNMLGRPYGFLEQLNLFVRSFRWLALITVRLSANKIPADMLLIGFSDS